MTKKVLSSRERLLLTMQHEETDYVPCSFMMFHALRDRYPGDQIRFVEEQLRLGLDAVVELPELPVTFHPDVTTETWREDNVRGENYPLLHKDYHTPAGILTTVVRKTDDWPHGDEVKFYDDYNVPRSKRYHVNTRGNFKNFRYLLMPPTSTEIKEYREQCLQLKKFAQKNSLLVRGVRGTFVDAAIRFAGVENLVFKAIDDPDYVEELLHILWDWNMHRMEIVLDEAPDLFLRRGWYENMSFWSPDMFRRLMMPYLQKEVRLAHEAGVKFGYINSCSYMRLLDDFLKIGFDVLIGIDPVEDKELDMAEVKRRLYGKVSLWGGSNGFVTIEQGTKEQIQQEVFNAFEVLAPGGGFILSPVDNVRDMSERTLQNAMIFIETWKARKDGDYYYRPVR